MANTTRIIAQLAPSAATLTPLYQAPPQPNISVNSVMVCNRSPTPTSFRIAVQLAGASIDVSQYLYYDLPIQGNDTFAFALGLTLSSNDIISVYATLATLSFSLFGGQS